MTKRKLRIEDHPDIKIIKAHCGAFGTGFCYGACGCFYTGHFETFDEALYAAVKTKMLKCDAALSRS
jgi:hypothetical protein